MIAGEAPGAGARSLYVQLLDWMMVPLIIVWPLALLFTYVAAQSSTYCLPCACATRLAVYATCSVLCSH